MKRRDRDEPGRAPVRAGRSDRGRGPEAGGPPDHELIYGVHPVLELLRARPQAIREILTARRLEGGAPGELGALARTHGIPVRQLSRAEIVALAGSGVHQGILARLSGSLPSVEDPVELVELARAAGREPLILVLDGVQDPHNLGALVRSAQALGADGVVIPKDRAADLTGVAVKASAGAAAHVPVARVVNLARALDTLKDAGLWVIGAALDEAEEADRVDLTGPIALVVGAEGAGIRRNVLERCDRRVRIPMKDSAVASLNASVAGAILLYEVARQRRIASAG